MVLDRVQKLRDRLATLELDALLVTDLLNVRYLSGFVGTFAVLLVTHERVFLITDSRYTQQAAEQCPHCVICQIERSWIPYVQSLVNELSIERLGFEDHSLSYKDWNELNSGLQVGELVCAGQLIEDLRMIKDTDEISAIRMAAKIADAAYAYITSFIKPGLRERDVVIELDYFIRKAGAEKEAFDSIVISGARSALPHGKPSDRVICKGDLLLMDFGARCEGYHSDITRTVVLGPPSDEQLKVYEIVLEAQSRAVSKVRPGVSGKEIDAIARDFIAEKDLGCYFRHGLGHALGLAVHDGKALSQYSELILQPGMVVTVEPGIYIPDWGGVRVEDDLLVTDSGFEVLTMAPKRLELGFPQ